MIDKWSRPDLTGVVAIVTGARRNIGRGIAVVLGRCGATVYVTTKPRSEPPEDGFTIEQTAETVTSVGGRGIAIDCDHDEPDDIAELFRRIESEAGGLDLLVNNVVHWGMNEPWGRPPWKQSLDWWQDNIRTVTAHYTTTCQAVPLMMGRPHPLIVSTCEGQGHTDVPTHQRAEGTAAMIGAFQHWAAPEGIDAVGVIPGEPRTHVEPDPERLDAIHAAMLASADPDDARATLSRAPFEFQTQKVDYVFRTQSIEFPGRAVATLYALDHRSTRGGQMWTASDLGRDYGFTDVDGLQPVDPVYGSG